MSRKSLGRTLRQCVIVCTMIIAGLAIAVRVDSAPKKGPFKRVQPKAPADDGVFYKDVFGEALSGARPGNLGSVASSRPDPMTGGGGTETSPSPMGGGGTGWSAIISADTIENEIKKIKSAVEADVTTPTDFNGLGHKKCRKNFSLLGMLFAIAGEYEGDVRWKKDAPKARDLFSRAGRNCKAATPASYNESKARKQDLADLVGGSPLASGQDAPAKADWSTACERSELMKRIEASNKRLRELAANAGAFSAGADEARHEAEMMAAMAAVMKKEGMPEADDTEYTGHCDIVLKSAKDLIEAAKQKSFEATSKPLGDINKACDACHEVYRG